MIQINKKRLIKTFFDLVEINSPSGQEDQVANYLIKKLKFFNLKYKIDKFGNIISCLHGSGRPILYLAHMDVVEPCKDIKPILKNSIIRSQANTVLGADMKANIAGILEVIAYFSENKTRHLPIEIIFTREEETGLFGARALNKKNTKSKRAILFDGSGPIGGIALKEAGCVTAKIKIFGKQAHVGNGNGISAIKTAGEIIFKLKFGIINNQSLFNIGLIKGGDAVNTVAGYAEMEADIRSLDQKKLKNLIQQMKNTIKQICQKNKAKYKIQIDNICPPYNISKNSKLVKKIVKKMQKLKIRPRYYFDIGASEAGILNQMNIQAIDLAYGGREDHNVKENISVKDLVLMTKFLICFVV